MQAVYIVLVALVAAASASRLQEVINPSVRAGINDQIKALLEEFKKNMNKPQYGLPALDPLVITHLDLNINEQIATLKGTLDDFKMVNLSTFVVESVNLNLLGLSLTFNISLASLDISGAYDIDGTIGGDLLPIYGKGPFDIKVGDLWASGAIKIGSNNSFIYLKQFDLDYHLGLFQGNIAGLLGGGDLSDVINQVINDFIPTVAEKYKTQISGVISDLIVGVANKMLDGVTLKDILDLINGKGTTAAPGTTPAAPVF
ncbi:uncharacterized protein [Anabrus simplex]|uniref:uncharacterized protein n=1 Tax=Anabrus simplex TaxID=316456 RepID=UPI0035A33B9D